MPRVLITDGQERSVLAAVRCLHDGDYDVAVASARRLALARWSRFVAEKPIVPDPRTDQREFLHGIEQVVKTGRYDVLLPGSDAALHAIVAGRHLLEPYLKIGLPPSDALDRAFDRRALSEAAVSAGLTSPPSILCRGVSAARGAAAAFGFPVVLKTRWPVVLRGREAVKVKSRIVDSVAELEAVLPSFGEEYVVQALVHGEEISFAGVVTQEHGLLGSAVSRYVRTWPTRAGDVCFSETIGCSSELRDCVESLLRSLGWTGMFELEMIRADDGRHVVTDFNPRAYGSLAVAARAGAPLSAIWCDSLLGRRAGSVAARPGIRYRREDGDLAHGVWQIRHGHVGAGLAVLRPRRRVAHALFSIRDPLPLPVRALEIAGRRLWRRRANAPARPGAAGWPATL